MPPAGICCISWFGLSNKAACKVWSQVGMQVFRKLVFFAGAPAEGYAKQLASRPAEALPLLKTKDGGTRQIPKINRLLLLQRLQNPKKTSTRGDENPQRFNTQILRWFGLRC